MSTSNPRDQQLRWYALFGAEKINMFKFISIDYNDTKSIVHIGFDGAEKKNKVTI